MTTITIQVPAKAKSKLSAIVKEMGGEIISVVPTKSLTKKARLIEEIKQGLRDVKKIREGKAKGYSMSDLFNNE